MVVVTHRIQHWGALRAQDVLLQAAVTRFEYCVSCCLQPEKKSMLKVLLETASNLVFQVVETHFDLCLANCRTSSLSVVHENTYRDQTYKHCYGANRPHLSVIELDAKERLDRVDRAKEALPNEEGQVADKNSIVAT
eukprot:Colp12_sorted_trinity150504_noHs@22595